MKYNDLTRAIEQIEAVRMSPETPPERRRLLDEAYRVAAKAMDVVFRDGLDRIVAAIGGEGRERVQGFRIETFLSGSAPRNGEVFAQACDCVAKIDRQVAAEVAHAGAVALLDALSVAMEPLPGEEVARIYRDRDGNISAVVKNVRAADGSTKRTIVQGEK